MKNKETFKSALFQCICSNRSKGSDSNRHIWYKRHSDETKNNTPSKSAITDMLLAKGVSDDVVNEMININLLLKGSPRLSPNENKQIFSIVQTFIAESKRFT